MWRYRLLGYAKLIHKLAPPLMRASPQKLVLVGKNSVVTSSVTGFNTGLLTLLNPSTGDSRPFCDMRLSCQQSHAVHFYPGFVPRGLARYADSTVSAIPVGTAELAFRRGN